MNLQSKIIYGFERLSDAFKTLLWDQAKKHGISPIQIQILLFVANHKTELCNVSQLALEFNVTKPTISDAVRVLINKKYLQKDYSLADGRSFALLLTLAGEQLMDQLSAYSLPISNQLDKMNTEQLTQLYSSISQMIYQLNQSGVLQVQRVCFGCRFYEKKDGHYCNFLKKKLKDTEVRLDCGEYEAVA